MRTLYLLILLAGMLLPCSALTVIPDPEDDKRQAAYGKLNSICIGHLETVTDRTSADAAAKNIKAARKKHRIDGRDFTNEKDILQSMSEKLSKQYFHGSAALAEELDYPLEDAIIPTPLTDAIMEQLQEKLVANLCKPFQWKEAYQRLARQEGFNEELLVKLPKNQAEILSGGPGFTRETAWMVDTEDERKAQFTASQMRSCSSISSQSSSTSSPKSSAVSSSQMLSSVEYSSRARSFIFFRARSLLAGEYTLPVAVVSHHCSTTYFCPSRITSRVNTM